MSGFEHFVHRAVEGESKPLADQLDRLWEANVPRNSAAHMTRFEVIGCVADPEPEVDVPTESHDVHDAAAADRTYIHAQPLAAATSASNMNPGLTPVPRMVAPPARAASSICAARSGKRLNGNASSSHGATTFAPAVRAVKPITDGVAQERTSGVDHDIRILGQHAGQVIYDDRTIRSCGPDHFAEWPADVTILLGRRSDDLCALTMIEEESGGRLTNAAEATNPYTNLLSSHSSVRRRSAGNARHVNMRPYTEQQARDCQVGGGFRSR